MMKLLSVLSVLSVLILTLSLAAPLVVAQSVTLAWDANTEPTLAGYRVYRSVTAGVYGDPVSGLVVPSAAPMYTDAAGLTYGVPYFYVVRAELATGERSLPSNEVSVTIADPNQLPAPTGLTATCSESGLVVSASWQAVPGAQFYLIRAVNETTGQLVVYEDMWMGTTFAWTTTVAGSRWRFWVHGSNGAIGPSSAVWVQCPPKAPVNVRDAK